MAATVGLLLHEFNLAVAFPFTSRSSQPPAWSSARLFFGFPRRPAGRSSHGSGDLAAATSPRFLKSVIIGVRSNRLSLKERQEGQAADPQLMREMTMWKNGKTTEQVAEELLRNYLIRCHEIISKDYPEIAGMEPTKAADYLLHLRRTGRVEITLFNKSPDRIGCKIVNVDAKKEE